MYVIYIYVYIYIYIYIYVRLRPTPASSERCAQSALVNQGNMNSN